jgi:hypothetical protein
MQEVDPLGWPTTQIRSDISSITLHLQVHEHACPVEEGEFLCDQCRRGVAHNNLGNLVWLRNGRLLC